MSFLSQKVKTIVTWSLNSYSVLKADKRMSRATLSWSAGRTDSLMTQRTLVTSFIAAGIVPYFEIQIGIGILRSKRPGVSVRTISLPYQLVLTELANWVQLLGFLLVVKMSSVLLANAFKTVLLPIPSEPKTRIWVLTFAASYKRFYSSSMAYVASFLA